MKNRVLTAFPDLTTLAQGRELLLVLSHEIGDVLLEAKNRDSDSIYEALKIHGATREKSLIDTFYKLGICISYDRLLTISTDITNRVIDRYDRDGVVCPSKLRIFTTAAIDNIDHNPSSTSSHDSFHGTVVSLVQHPTTEKPGTDRATDVFDPSKSSTSKKIASLPSYYSEVPPLTLPSSDIVVPNTSGRLVSTLDRDATSKHNDREEVWLNNTRQVLNGREHKRKHCVVGSVPGFKIIAIISSTSFNIVAVDVYRERSLPCYDCTCHQCHQLSR